MKERLLAHLNVLFNDLPQTQRVLEMKEELMANLIDKYEDLLAQGYSEEEAYHAAVSSIGDMGEFSRFAKQKEGSSSSFVTFNIPWGGHVSTLMLGLITFVGVFVVLMILSVIITAMFWQTDSLMRLPICATFALLFAVVSSAFAMVGSLMMRKDGINGGSLADQLLARHSVKKVKKLYGTLTQIFWMVIVIAYLLISFFTMRWDITWLIFIMGSTFSTVLHIMYLMSKPEPNFKRIKGNCYVVLWLTAVVLYFLVSFSFGNWHISWIIFPIAALLTQVLHLTFHLRT